MGIYLFVQTESQVELERQEVAEDVTEPTIGQKELYNHVEKLLRMEGLRFYRIAL